MHASHVYLDGLDLPVIRSNELVGRARLIELHINASKVETIQPLAFNTLPNLKVGILVFVGADRPSDTELRILLRYPRNPPCS